MHLQSPECYKRVDGMTSFVASDESGSFGILPGHERMMTVLTAGIARIFLLKSGAEYLGLPECFLYFVDNELFISTSMFLRDKDYANLTRALKKKIDEEAQLRLEMKETIRRVEAALLKEMLRSSTERPL
ncbi:MAG TPA: hypothetical protein V6C86_15810 [Oculatellaceae cyanobacterium]